MAIEVKTMVGENTPVKVGIDAEKDLLCKCCQDHKVVKMAMIRGSAFELRTLLPQWFASLGLEKVESHAQSESDGNLSVSVIYR